MRPVRTARFLIGCSLAVLPAVCFAQGTGSGSTQSGSGTVMQQQTPTDLLAELARGALPLKDVVPTDKQRAAWAAETKRYADRSTELRSRCHDELRKANRDTIVAKSSLCLRSDLLLEATFRRNQRDMIATTKGVPADDVALATKNIDYWLEAETAIVDGIDTGVFTTVDTMKEAKKNLHLTYRKPMLAALARVRASQVRAVIHSIALAVQPAFPDLPTAVQDAFPGCLASAEGYFKTEGGLDAVTHKLYECVDLLGSSK